MNSWIRWLAGDDQKPGSDLAKTGIGEEFAPAGFPNALCVTRLVNLFIALGLVARVIRFGLGFPLWDDESFLCVNFISRSFVELLQPLDYHQVAPVLFLWTERLSVRLFGFSEYALRLFPFVCSIASLFLFRRVAERLLSGVGLIFAIAIFSVSYPGIRYAAEAKQYCSDMFVSLILLALVVSWYQKRDLRRLAFLMTLTPVALGFSYPAVFTAGGLSLCVACVLLARRATFNEWILWSFWNLSIVASFGFWFRVVASIQTAAEGDFMGEYWKVNFPPIAQPRLLPYWILKTHASDFLAYPLGGPNWASSLTFIICCAGLYKLIAGRQYFCLGLLFGPVTLHFIAAALQKYPYGGHVKFSQYASPMICCLAAAGISQFLEWQSKWGVATKRNFAFSCAALAIVGCVSIARDVTNPYKTRSDFRARAFAQAFWVGTHSVEEVACVKSDLGLDFVPDQHRELSWSAHYLCNRAIEISRYALQPAKTFDHVSATRPLRCVLYRDARYQVDQARLDDWLADMNARYELVAHESLPFPRMAKNERTLVTMEYVDSYRFVPRNPSVKELPPLADGPKPSPH